MSKVSRSQLSTQEVLRQLAAAQAERDAAQVARDAAQAARKVAENKVFDLENEVQAQALLVRQLHIQLKSLSRKLAAATDRSEQQVFKWELDRVQKRLDELNRELWQPALSPRRQLAQTPQRQLAQSIQRQLGQSPQRWPGRGPQS